jgi:hypothetical protein
MEVSMRKVVQVLLALTALVGTAAFVTAKQDRPGPTIARWEYRVVRMAEPVTQDATPMQAGGLTPLGREGWELVGVTLRQIQVHAELQTETIFYLKKPIIGQ